MGDAIIDRLYDVKDEKVLQYILDGVGNFYS